MSFGRRLGGRRKPTRQDDDEAAPTIVGGAHLVLGAIGLTSAGVALLFNANTPLLLAVLVARIVFEVATCYAGLLMKDGNRRGGIIAIVTGVVRAALLVLSGAWGLTLLLSVVLIGAVVWLLPTLGPSESKGTPV